MRRVGALLVIGALLFTACSKEGSFSGTKGGTLKIAANADVDYIDPGQIYYNHSYMLFRVMIRNLVNFPTITPDNNGTKMIPDLATDTGTVSADGLTYTFTLKDGVKYEPATAGGREIRSEDFRYAIERGFNKTVVNGYGPLYFQDVIVGDTEFINGKADHISGIDVSDPKTIVFHLRRKTGDFIYRLALPLASPVPPEYAKPFDAKNPSTYGPNFASTGPYMLERTGAKVTGYVPGKKIIMVRNPNWDAKTDNIRSAFPDRIEMTEGFSDPSLATNKIINGEFDLSSAELAIPPDKIQSILSSSSQKDQLQFDPSGGAFNYVFLNTSIKPFDNQHVRKAVNYVLDKNAMRLALGGPRTGTIAGNALMPGVLGFNEVGGATYDPYASPNHKGDVAKAQAEMKAAGFASGKYSGAPVLMVGADDPVGRRVDDVVEAGLAKIGIKAKRQSYDPNIMFTKYYNVPKAKVAIGPGAGWFFDYPDGYTVIKALFDGRLISPTGNNNYSVLNDKTLNDLIDKASAASGTERGDLWAQTDRRVMDLAPVIPWLWPTTPYVFSKRVRGVTYTLGTGTLDLATISLETAGG